MEGVRLFFPCGVLEDTIAMTFDGGGLADCALVGSQLAQLAITQGWGGIVVFGAVRDRDELQRLPLGVWALGVYPRRGSQAGAGARDVVVRFGGVTFEPGHWLCADSDGVIALPQVPPEA